MNDDLTELEKAQAVKIQELMVDNNRMRESIVEVQKAFTAMTEQDAKRQDIQKHYRYIFAGMSMQGMINDNLRAAYSHSQIAKFSVQMADALIEALEKEKRNE